MKRTLLFALLGLLILSLSTFAADSAKKAPMAAGIRAGFSLGTATGSDAEMSDGTKTSRFGFDFGGFFAFGVAKSFTLQPELLYVQKGVKYEEIGGPGKLTFKLDYLEIPVLIKFAPELQGSKIAPALFVGPYLGIRMGAKMKLEGSGGAVEVDAKDAFKSTDFGMTFGGGLGYKMARGEMFFDARYDLGLSKVMKADEDGYEADLKSGTFLILLGYKFNI
jgi:hypothetical protein